MKAATRKPPGGTDEAYRELRHTLILFFAWNRVNDPDELADETIFRIVQSSAESTEINNLPAFAHTVARHVLNERRRDQARAARASAQETGPAVGVAEKERLLNCLDKCRKRLSRAERELIAIYHFGEKEKTIPTRKKLAEKLGMTEAALRLRAFRVRKRLSAYMEKECVGLNER